MLVVKNLPADARDIRDAGSILGSGRSSRGGNGNPLQYSCLENPMEEEPGGLQSMGLWDLDTTEWLNMHTHASLKALSPKEVTYWGTRVRISTYECWGGYIIQAITLCKHSLEVLSLPCQRQADWLHELVLYRLPGVITACDTCYGNWILGSDTPLRAHFP